MKRRSFFGWFGMSWLASILPMAIASCSSQKSGSSPNPSSRPNGFIPVGTVAALNQTGFLKTEIAGKSVFILRDKAHKNTFRALNMTCTHAGCLVDWQATDKAFECPCHDSRFASDGKVLQGPAQKALQAYLAKLEGNTIFVNVN
jgi:cytochrome b6-f complex iron-sulfur subunit